MRCDEFRVRLNQSLDRRLDPETDWTLTSHADRCESCRSELTGQQLLREGMEWFDPPELPDSFAAEVTAVALQRSPARRLTRSRAWWSAGIAIAASLLIAFNFFGPAPHREAERVGDRAKTLNAGSLTRDKATTQPRTAPADSPPIRDSAELPADNDSPKEPILGQSDLFSLPRIDSDEIPGVRPLKTSLDVTISLLKQTIPGRSSSASKDPSTSQIFSQQWVSV